MHLKMSSLGDPNTTLGFDEIWFYAYDISPECLKNVNTTALESTNSEARSRVLVFVAI